ncbi:biogenesis of lysosome-related organelles complex 1 subunit 1-like [Dorcoceras hygrometricum]|uniref:Biogenesis of lysosome-related organelles complex 1 subunit 1-like n=1 Tax=Dorcoceras hygrometricum TaxID=472368 RepID=A0A2Z7CV68_9LAMI|nr:biogenesis of lysosome-related organelles complex 1 subunit 1-like [Dorcoceras hygrometricum]
MNSRRICPADGSQYIVSAVGLVFMESAAGLAMETSKVESAVRNQAEAKLNQLEHNKPAGTMTTIAIQEAKKSRKLELERRESAGSYSGIESAESFNQQLSTKISAEDESSRSDGSAVKQLTTYENWMSTAELNSNGESDKTQSTLKMERFNG